MDFKEMRLPLEISAWMVGGPMWSTRLFPVQNGDVSRLGLYQYPLHKFDIPAGELLTASAPAVKRFQMGVRGKLRGFRVLDPYDYTAGAGEGKFITTATSGIYQMVKVYTDDTGDTFVRQITKPIPGTCVVTKAGTVVTDPINYRDGTANVNSVASITDLAWTGAFDVPVCFTEDWLQMGSNSNGTLLTWSNAHVMEIRRIGTSYGTPPPLYDPVMPGSVGTPAPSPAPGPAPGPAPAPSATAITIAPTSRTISTGASGVTFAIGANGPPASSVTVAVLSSDSSDVITPASVTLTPTTYTGQTVTVATSQAGAKTIGTSNNGGLTNATATLTANDPPATTLTISPSTLGVVTGAGGTFTISSNYAPASPVTVSVTSSDATDMVSPSSVVIQAGARTASVVVTTNNPGTKTIATTNNGGLANVSATLTATGAAPALAFNDQRLGGGTLSNNGKTLTSAASSNSTAGSEGTASVRQGDNAVGRGFAIEFSIDSLSTSGKLELKIDAFGNGSVDDPDFNFNEIPFFQSSGYWASGSDSGTATAWATGDKIAPVVYDLTETFGAGTSARVAFFHNGTFVGSGQFTGMLPAGFIILGKTGSAVTNAVTLNNDIATMTYGSTYKAYRDSSSVQTMTDAIGWPNTSVIEKQATAVTLDGPSTGTTGIATAFTVSANGRLSGSVIVTPASNQSGDTFSPATVTLTDGARGATINVTAAADGAHGISVTNNAALTNAGSPLTYTTTTPPPPITLTSGVAKNWAMTGAAQTLHYQIAATGSVRINTTGAGGSVYVFYKNGAYVDYPNTTYDNYFTNPGTVTVTGVTGTLYIQLYPFGSDAGSGTITATQL